MPDRLLYLWQGKRISLVNKELDNGAPAGVATWRGYLTQLLYSEGICSLGIQIGGIFVFLGASAKPAEATGGARQRFIGLVARRVQDMVSYARVSSSPS